ncbi:deiodinase-like protein [Spirosoma radiotolerans]|uniref:Thioredoxin domain-containing protein n=1 Tax=Spirosoma radiotolerans TaxID=1379870 RepID=A0A0E3ZTQ8_9BACT|nr:deiodinase-like protein [Spirosoma radiotolerans]AKD54710.1 hypothetical protein SD10_07095 [Spirosoma radiotolerans]
MTLISYLSGLLLLLSLSSCSTNHITQNNQKQSLTDGAKVDLPLSAGINNNYRDFNKIGYQKGDKIKNVTLLSIDGETVNFAKVMANNKPLLLISGSYTCDISRRNIPDINALTVRYKDRANVYLVYTIDAHPSDVVSPYSKNNRIEIAPANTRDQVEASQPKTYSERKLLARKWQQRNNLLAPVLVDNPTNDFWLAFGQAPNMAFLINPDGTVYYKQVWFKFVDLNESLKGWFSNQSKNTTSP